MVVLRRYCVTVIRPGQVIALCVLALLTIGVVMVNSAGMAVNADPARAGVTAQGLLLSKSTVYMGLAMVGLAAGAFFPLRGLAEGMVANHTRRPAPLGWMFFLCFVLIGLMALVYVPGLSRARNGSHRWIELPVPGLGDALSIQPSEFAKLALVAMIAWYAATRATVIHQFWRGLVPALMAVGLVAGFIVIEDLGTGILVASASCIVLIAGGARLWQFLMFVPVAGAGLVAAVIANPYRLKRLTAFMDPYADAEKSGYHMIQSMAAVVNGQGFGRGLGHGLQKMGYLPEDQTDFLFAIVCEELGIAGAAIVIALFVIMIWAGLRVVRREPVLILKLLGLGILCIVGLQALINLAVVTGLGPTKGIALPLVSSGGTGWTLTAFALGLLVSIDRAHHEDEYMPARSVAA